MKLRIKKKNCDIGWCLIAYLREIFKIKKVYSQHRIIGGLKLWNYFSVCLT